MLCSLQILLACRFLVAIVLKIALYLFCVLCSDRGPGIEQHITDNSAPAGGQDESPLSLGGLPSPSKCQHRLRGEPGIVAQWDALPSGVFPRRGLDCALMQKEAVPGPGPTCACQRTNFGSSFVLGITLRCQFCWLVPLPTDLSHQPQNSNLYNLKQLFFSVKTDAGW